MGNSRSEGGDAQAQGRPRPGQERGSGGPRGRYPGRQGKGGQEGGPRRPFQFQQEEEDRRAGSAPTPPRRTRPNRPPKASSPVARRWSKGALRLARGALRLRALLHAETLFVDDLDASACCARRAFLVDAGIFTVFFRQDEGVGNSPSMRPRAIWATRRSRAGEVACAGHGPAGRFPEQFVVVALGSAELAFAEAGRGRCAAGVGAGAGWGGAAARRRFPCEALGRAVAGAADLAAGRPAGPRLRPRRRRRAKAGCWVAREHDDSQQVDHHDGLRNCLHFHACRLPGHGGAWCGPPR